MDAHNRAVDDLDRAAAQELLALLAWTRRRMLGRAAWVAAVLVAGTGAAGLSIEGGAPLAALGGLLGLAGLVAASRAYAYDVRHLPIERAAQRFGKDLIYDPEATLPAGLAARSGMFDAGTRLVADEGLLAGTLAGRPLRAAVVRAAGRPGLFVVIGGDGGALQAAFTLEDGMERAVHDDASFVWAPAEPPRAGSLFVPIADPAPLAAYLARWRAAIAAARAP